MIRWFMKRETAGAVPNAVYKAEFNDDGTMKTENVWWPQYNEWRPSTAVFDYLFNGDARIDEVGLDELALWLPIHAKGVIKGADRDEIKTFIKFLNKKPTRRFDFIHIPETYGDTLNKFVEVKDYDSARLYAERYLL